MQVNRDRFRFEFFLTGKRVCVTIEVDLRVLAVALIFVAIVSLAATRTLI